MSYKNVHPSNSCLYCKHDLLNLKGFFNLAVNMFISAVKLAIFTTSSRSAHMKSTCHVQSYLNPLLSRSGTLLGLHVTFSMSRFLVVLSQCHVLGICAMLSDILLFVLTSIKQVALIKWLVNVNTGPCRDLWRSCENNTVYCKSLV